MSNKKSVYLTAETEQILDGLSESLSGAVNKVVDRYGHICKSELPGFAESELNLIYDCCNGTIFEPAELNDGSVLANVEDAIALDGLDKKWSIDAAALIHKLKQLSPAQNTALIHAIEKFWSQH